MTLTDLRIVEWNLYGTAGMSRTVTFTEQDDNAITSLSVWLGGTLTDVDDLTGATEYAATISGSSNEVATVTVPIPTTTSQTTPLRLELDGSVRTVGKLQPRGNGQAVPGDADLTLATDGASFALTVTGGLISVGAIDGGTADSNFTGTTPIDGGTA